MNKRRTDSIAASCAPRTVFRTALWLLALLFCRPALAEISDGEIRVGLLIDLKSTYAHLSGRGSEVAARMAIEELDGKVAGQPIRLVVADHGNNAEQAAEIARRWLHDEGIDVIAEVTGSPPALAVQEVNRQRQAVVFYNGVMTSALTGTHCAPTGIHWMYDGYAFTSVIGRELTRQGATSWYFVVVDNAFGNNVAEDLTRLVDTSGGRVIGLVHHRFGEEQLFASLRQAAQSGASAIALINAGNDLIRAVRQSFDLLTVSKGTTVLAAVATTINDVHLMKPSLAQGLRLSHSFYWNLDEETRAWSKRFFQIAGTMPNDMQAGVYSSLTHYFKAVAASRSDHGPTVVKQMRELPIRDAIVRNAKLRSDGRMVHDVFLMQVKKPAEIVEPWDYLRVLKTIPGDQAFKPQAEGGCTSG
ncbi:MAG TPA: ABC transporter substrate-binding protein [Rhodocyclaceae bacterium]|nr:ABC transporter substrate-binding protein [Rhodocyclaceae bacterium]